MIIKINRRIVSVIVACVLMSFLSYIVIGLTGLYSNEIIAIFWAAFYTIIVVYFFYGICGTNKVRNFVYLSWLVRLALVPVDMMSGLSRQPDQLGFMLKAEQIILGGDINDTTGWGSVLASEYKVYGISQFLPKLTNAFIVMISIAIAMRCMRKLNVGLKAFEIAAFIMLFAPMSMILSITALREPVYYLCFVASLYWFIDCMKYGKIKYLVQSILVMCPAVLLHSGHIVVVLAYLIVYIFIYKGKMSKHLMMTVTILALAVVGVLLLKKGIIASGYFGSLFTSGDWLLSFGSYLSWSNQANYELSNSGYLPWTISVTSPMQVLAYTPLRMLYFLFSPMLWDVSGVAELLAFVCDSTIFIYVAYEVMKNRRILKRKTTNVLMIKTGIVIILLTALVFGWGTINSGTATRHRDFLIPLLCIMIAILRESTSTHKAVQKET